MILVDTDVLIDVITEDPDWLAWSRRRLEAAALKGPIAIDDVIYAELSVGFDGIETLDAVLDRTGLAVQRTPREALFLAGKAFRRYRALGASARACSRTSSSGPTPPSPPLPCSPATPVAIAAVFRHSS